MRGMSWRTVAFLLILGAVVYSIRGSGLGSGRWKAVAVMAVVIVMLIIAQLVGAWAGARRRRRSDDSDGP